MGLKKLKEVALYFKEHIDVSAVNCLFVDQNNSRKQIYKAYNLNCDIGLIKGTVEGTLDNLISCIENRTLTDYDFEYNQEETIQHLNKKDVLFSEEIIGNITVNFNDSNTLSDATKMDKLDFIVIQLIASNKEIEDLYLFKKHIKSSTAFRKSVKLVFDGTKPVLFNKSILTISDNIDTVLLDDKYYIISRSGFNSIFNYKEGFKKIIDNSYSDIMTLNVFSDTENFITDCKSHGLHLPRLAKAVASGCFENLQNNTANIKSVKETYGLTIQISDDNKIIYSGKEDIPEILNMLLEHYVISALSNKAMLAKAIEKYNVRA